MPRGGPVAAPAPPPYPPNGSRAVSLKGAQPRTLDQHRNSAYAAAFPPGGTAIAGSDGAAVAGGPTVCVGVLPTRGLCCQSTPAVAPRH